MTSQADIVIIGSGMGGATVAAGLTNCGARIIILEKGGQLPDTPESRDARAIFQRGYYRPREDWFNPKGEAFNPGNYYYIGGNTKFYGAVMIRYRKEDFAEIEFTEGGLSPQWPITYEDMEPWYGNAEALYQVRGMLGEDPTEPFHSNCYPYPPVPDEPAIARVRERLKGAGVKPFSLPLGIDIGRWLKRAKTPWDAFPDTRAGKMDAETCGLAKALMDPNIRLETGAEVTRLETDQSNHISRVVYRQRGEERALSPRIVILSAGAVQSAVLLLKSADSRNPNGLANASDQVGRNFMNHNLSALLAIDPRERNDSVYQKTFGINDFYLDDRRGGGPLGNIQLLGRVSGAILKAQINWAPEWTLSALSSRAVDWLLMSEDLPRPESRVMVKDSRIVLDWQRSNMAAHRKLAERAREVFRAAGYPIVITKPFDRRTPSHQCGTLRIGNDPATSVLDGTCKSWDHPNLYVVDAGFLPTSAAVNPALTIAAQALRTANHLRTRELEV
jgi:choline dehydrogenase-like flavoprotein